MYHKYLCKGSKESWISGRVVLWLSCWNTASAGWTQYTLHGHRTSWLLLMAREKLDVEIKLLGRHDVAQAEIDQDGKGLSPFSFELGLWLWNWRWCRFMPCVLLCLGFFSLKILKVTISIPIWPAHAWSSNIKSPPGMKITLKIQQTRERLDMQIHNTYSLKAFILMQNKPGKIYIAICNKRSKIFDVVLEKKLLKLCVGFLPQNNHRWF